jgi:hypothetical protein
MKNFCNNACSYKQQRTNYVVLQNPKSPARYGAMSDARCTECNGLLSLFEHVRFNDQFYVDTTLLICANRMRIFYKYLKISYNNHRKWLISILFFFFC